MAQLVLNPFVGPFSAGLRGERADTVLLRNLPCLWFGASKGLPSDEVLRNAFASFGAVAKVVALHSQGSSKDDDDFAALMNINFDVYVQYESVEAVLALLATCHGRELQRTRNDKVFKARIEACLDTSEYLSKRNIRKRKQEAEMVEVEAPTAETMPSCQRWALCRSAGKKKLLASNARLRRQLAWKQSALRKSRKTDDWQPSSARNGWQSTPASIVRACMQT